MHWLCGQGTQRSLEKVICVCLGLGLCSGQSTFLVLAPWTVATIRREPQEGR